MNGGQVIYRLSMEIINYQQLNITNHIAEFEFKWSYALIRRHVCCMLAQEASPRTCTLQEQKVDMDPRVIAIVFVKRLDLKYCAAVSSLV